MTRLFIIAPTVGNLATSHACEWDISKTCVPSLPTASLRRSGCVQCSPRNLSGLEMAGHWPLLLISTAETLGQHFA